MVSADLTSSVELVYQRTRRAILTGDYLPGSALRLQELADRNGVSMIPVREALRLLASEGFVDLIPNRGARVASLSAADMIDVYRTRIVLEMEALRQAAPHIDPAMLTRAREINERIVQQFIDKGYAEYDDHRAFHFALYEPSGSNWLMKLIAIVWDHTERYRRLGAPFVTAAETREQHELILDRLAARDFDGAVQALADHLNESSSRLQIAVGHHPGMLRDHKPLAATRD